VLLVILVMRKRIKLVIQLFQEAGKAINSMPLLLFEPVLVCNHNPSVSYILFLPKEHLLGGGEGEGERARTNKCQEVNLTYKINSVIMWTLFKKNYFYLSHIRPSKFKDSTESCVSIHLNYTGYS